MCTIDEIRQVFQEVLGPELRAINARLDSIDRRFPFFDQRFKASMTISNAGHDSAIKDVAHARYMLKIDRRLARLESKQSQVA
jgi:hypothetical protein